MCRQMIVPSSSHALKKGSQWPPKMCGQPSFAGFSENVTAWQPFFAAPDLVGHELRVPDRRDRERDEPAGVGAAPLVDVPVVVRLEQVETDVEVLGAREQLTAELHEAREAHRAEHAVAVHVVDALMDVPAALADAGERGGLDAVLLGRLAGDGVQADVGDLGPLVGPDVGAVVLVDELRGGVLPLVGKVGVEEGGWLDDVVVDAHEDEIFGLHGSPWSQLAGGS